jgi:hypothetical protein
MHYLSFSVVVVIHQVALGCKTLVNAIYLANKKDITNQHCIQNHYNNACEIKSHIPNLFTFATSQYNEGNSSSS